MSKPSLKTAAGWPEQAMGNSELDTTVQTEFTRLYRQYVTRIYRYLYARVGSQAVAEDLTAQVFLAAMQAYPAFTKKKSGNLPAWLFTIARNKMVDRHRRERRLVPLEYADALPAAEPDPLAGVIARENSTALQLALSNLPAHQRELLELRYAGELSYREIAAIVGKREGAVKMAVRRLIRKLQAELENENV